MIISVYNSAELIAEAIAGVRVQPYAPIESIIDDGSTDHTAQVV